MTDATRTILIRLTVEVDSPDYDDLECSDKCTLDDDESECIEHRPVLLPDLDEHLGREVLHSVVPYLGISSESPVYGEWERARTLAGHPWLPSGKFSGERDCYGWKVTRDCYEWKVTDAEIVEPPTEACAWCGKSFTARSGSGRQRAYCSDRCRQAAYRARQG